MLSRCHLSPLALYQLLLIGPPTCGEYNRRIVCDAGSGFGVASKFTLGFMPLCSLINVFVSNLSSFHSVSTTPLATYQQLCSTVQIFKYS